MRLRTLTASLVFSMLAMGSVDASSPGEPTQVDFDECNRQGQLRLNPLTTTGASTETPVRRSRWSRSKEGSTLESPPNGVPDEFVRGMDRVGYRNEHYRKAYRECMKERGF